MTVVEEVLAFTRDYVNNNSKRTPERIRKIREAYKLLTGETVRTACQSCYIEILFKIRSIMEKPITRYQLKPGALLQAFGDTSKTCTNKNLTDELAEWHLKNNPGVAVLFSKIPAEFSIAPDDAKIVKPNKTLTKKEKAEIEAKKVEEEKLAQEEVDKLAEEQRVKDQEADNLTAKAPEPKRSHKAGAGKNAKTS